MFTDSGATCCGVDVDVDACCKRAAHDPGAGALRAVGVGGVRVSPGRVAVAVAIAGGGNRCVEEKLVFDFDVVGLYPATRLRFFVLEVPADDQASSATGLGRGRVLRTWVFVAAASNSFDDADDDDDALVVATDAELMD